MKYIISLLLVLFFASCGKQEVFVFKKEYEDFVDFSDIPKEGWKSNVYSIQIKVEFTFEPVDEEGFTFFDYKITASEDDLQKYNLHKESMEFDFAFYDKKKRELFSFNPAKLGSYSGKSEYSRALLERVEEDFLYFSVKASQFEKSKNGSMPNMKELFLMPNRE